MSIIITICILFIMTFPVIISTYIYSSVLTKPSMILEGLNNYLETHLPEWLYLPVIGCYRCTSGQGALWTFPFIICPAIGLHYNIFLHIFFICCCIYNVEFIKFLFEKLVSEEKEMKED